MRAIGVVAIAAALTVLAARAEADPKALLDRAVARFVDPEASESSASRFVMMRELVIESWLAAYERAPDAHPTSFDAKAIRAALERHVIEETLSARLVSLDAPAAKILEAKKQVRLVETIAVGDESMLNEALARANGVSPDVEKSTQAGAAELEAIFMRRARAELYLEVAVAQAGGVSEAELRTAFAKAPPYFAGKSYDAALPDLRTWVRGEELRDASQAYYQAVRGRLRIEIIPQGKFDLD